MYTDLHKHTGRQIQYVCGDLCTFYSATTENTYYHGCILEITGVVPVAYNKLKISTDSPTRALWEVIL
jgi:hypothetical protein